MREVKELLQYGNFLSIMHWHSYFCFKTITVVVIYEYCNILLQGEQWRLNSNNEQCSKWTLISKIIYKNFDPTKFIDHHCMVFDLKILIVWWWLCFFVASGYCKLQLSFRIFCSTDIFIAKNTLNVLYFVVLFQTRL